MLTLREKEISRLIQGDIPLAGRPFLQLGEKIGRSEEELIRTILSLRKRGIIRKFGAVVRHTKAGYEKNAMVVWVVPPGHEENVGEILSSFSEVTHCYERKPPFEGKYSVFSMIHFKDRFPRQLLEKIAASTGVGDYKILWSEREFKKSSMEYF